MERLNGPARRNLGEGWQKEVSPPGDRITRRFSSRASFTRLSFRARPHFGRREESAVVFLGVCPCLLRAKLEILTIVEGSRGSLRPIWDITIYGSCS